MNFFLKERFHQFFIFAFFVFLIFCLVFESHLDLPGLLSWSGRLHPVILHFPIVLVILSIFLSWTNKFTEVNLPLTIIAVYSALITAISGLFLSMEIEDNGDLLLVHKWLGVAVAFSFTIFYWMRSIPISKWLARSFGLLILLAIIATGHFGGMVTHGENFLTFDFQDQSTTQSLPEDPLIYDHIVAPILDKKCNSCHNLNKKKGDLILTNYAALKRGGKSGLTVDVENPEKSLLIDRVNLPDTDEKHMPPKGKNQLTTSEKEILEAWISSGTDPLIKLTDLKVGDQLATLVQRQIDQISNKPYEDLPEVSSVEINKFITNYCTINRVYQSSNALSVQIFPHKNYNPNELLKLKPLKRNIIELDLSNVSISKKEMAFAGSCTNLEKLDIDRTPLDDALFSEITHLTTLKFLKVYQTGITEQSIEPIVRLESLEKIYLWDTDISKKDIEILRSSRSDLVVDAGIDESIDFTSILPVPELKTGQRFFIEPLSITLTHPLAGIDIFYTRDSSIPTSKSELFSNKIIIDKPQTLKFIAEKEGWESSPIDSAVFYQTISAPDHFKLVYDPDPAYAKGGIDVLFNLNKGSKNFRDSTWVGFKDRPFELICQWEEPILIESITLSSIIVTGPHLFPPTSIVVLGGLDSLNLKTMGQLKPKVPGRKQADEFKFYSCPVKSESVQYLKIIASPIESLPVWHPAKGQQGWIFIDEVLMTQRKEEKVI